MPHYRDKDADGHRDEIIVIEDKTMVLVDEEGNMLCFRWNVNFLPFE